MVDIVEILIEHINNKVDEFGIEGLSVCRVTEFDENTTFPLITVEDLGNSEMTQYSPLYEREVLSSCGVQFNVFSNPMNISNEIYSAKRVCSIIMNKIDNIMRETPFTIDEISSCVRNSTRANADR